MVWFKKQGRGDMALFQHGCWTECQGWNWGMAYDGQYMHMDANGCDCEFGREYNGAYTLNRVELPVGCRFLNRFLPARCSFRRCLLAATDTGSCATADGCNYIRDMNDFADPQDNTWHQAVIAYAGNGDHYKAWYDGRVLVDNPGGGELSTCSTGDGSYNVRIGSHSYDEGWAFRGQMDEVAYWDTMLTDGQVARLYNDGDGLDLTTPYMCNIGAAGSDPSTTPGGSDPFFGQMDEVAIYGMALTADDIAEAYGGGNGANLTSGSGPPPPAPPPMLACEACPAGKRTGLGPDGQNNASERTCRACQAGRYTNETGTGTACIACAEGTGSPLVDEARTFCADCSPGQFNAALSSGDHGCIVCAIGQFAEQVGALACIECNAGTFIENTGSSTACQDCVSGQYQEASGQPSCSTCNVGMFAAAAGASTCIECVAGRFQNAAGASAECPFCEAGQFVDSIAAITCIACPAARWRNTSTAGDNLTDCKACATGKYLNSSSHMCDPCNATDFSNVSSVHACLLCIDGTQRGCISALCSPGACTTAFVLSLPFAVFPRCRLCCVSLPTVLLMKLRSLPVSLSFQDITATPTECAARMEAKFEQGLRARALKSMNGSLAARLSVSTANLSFILFNQIVLSKRCQHRCLPGGNRVWK